MQVDAGNGDEAGCFLSIRSSCDRCRVQKLKCSVPSGSGACERCTRAKLPCAFGRRTRSKRQPSNDERQTNPPATRTISQTVQSTPLTPFTSVTPLSTPTSTSGSVTASASASAPATTTVPQCELLSTAAPYMQLARPTESVPTPAPEIEPGSHDIRTWDNLTLGSQDTPNDVLEWESDMPNYGWPQPGFDTVDVNGFDSGKLELSPWSSQIDDSTATNWLTDITTTANIKASIDINSVIPTSQRLSALTLEIQQLLGKLEQGPWCADSARSLDDYPVGTILQLSQQFVAIAGLALNTTCVAGRVMMPCREKDEVRADATEGPENGSADDDNHDERKTSGAMVDTPTILLLLSGYMWLVRLFDVVLGHFQKHLTCMPSRFHYSGMAVAGRPLRLGELYYANAALCLQRIHIAVSMLLDALQDVEGHLGRGGKVVSNLAEDLLLNNFGRRQDDSYSCLGRRATAIKELLRDKMGL